MPARFWHRLTVVCPELLRVVGALAVACAIGVPETASAQKDACPAYLRDRKACPDRPVGPDTPGRLEIRSNPNGAKVEVDGKVAGKTPVELKEIGPAVVEVSLSLRGHERWVEPILIRPGEPIELDVTLCQRGKRPTASGVCCWPGQRARSGRCTGTPRCPAHHRRTADRTRCELAPCEGGQRRMSSGACCWSGQRWDPDKMTCAGRPARCPGDRVRTWIGCVPPPQGRQPEGDAIERAREARPRKSQSQVPPEAPPGVREIAEKTPAKDGGEPDEPPEDGPAGIALAVSAPPEAAVRIARELESQIRARGGTLYEAQKVDVALEEIDLAREGPPAAAMLREALGAGAVLAVRCREARERALACWVARADARGLRARSVAGAPDAIDDRVVGMALMLDIARPRSRKPMVVLFESRRGKLPDSLLSTWRESLAIRGAALVPAAEVSAARRALHLPRALEAEHLPLLEAAVGAGGTLRVIVRARRGKLVTARTEVRSGSRVSGAILQTELERLPRDAEALFDVLAGAGKEVR